MKKFVFVKSNPNQLTVKLNNTFSAKFLFLFLIFALVFCMPLIGVADKVEKYDDDGNGYKEKWAFFHEGKMYPYKMAYDYTKDGKTDFYVTISEKTGVPLSVAIDRNTWPVLKNIGTEKWKKDKKQAAIEFWKTSGNESGICDISNVTIIRGQGYILTTQEILSSEKYVKKEDRMMQMLGMNNIDGDFLRWQSFFQNSANTPWLICDDCIKDWMKPPNK